MILCNRVSGENLVEQQEENVAEHDGSIRAASSLSRRSQGTRASAKCIGKNNHLDVKELEVILEAYFVQIDASLNGLSTVRCAYFSIVV